MLTRGGHLTLLLLSKTELTLLAEPRYNISLTNVDSKHYEENKIGMILANNFQRTYHRTPERKEARVACKLATALSFRRNIDKGKYIETIISKSFFGYEFVYYFIDELTELRMKALINMKKNLVLSCEWMNNDPLNRKEYFNLIEHIQGCKLKCDDYFGFILAVKLMI